MHKAMLKVWGMDFHDSFVSICSEVFGLDGYIASNSQLWRYLMFCRKNFQDTQEFTVAKIWPSKTGIPSWCKARKDDSVPVSCLCAMAFLSWHVCQPAQWSHRPLCFTQHYNSRTCRSTWWLLSPCPLCSAPEDCCSVWSQVSILCIALNSQSD